MSEPTPEPAKPDIPEALGGNPLSDEDVRRREHPDEFPNDDDDESAGSAPVAPVLENSTSGVATVTVTGSTVDVATAPLSGHDPGATVSPSGAPAAPQQPADEPTAAPTVEPTEDPSREEELGLLAKIEADAKALRNKLFGGTGG